MEGLLSTRPTPSSFKHFLAIFWHSCKFCSYIQKLQILGTLVLICVMMHLKILSFFQGTLELFRTKSLKKDAYPIVQQNIFLSVNFFLEPVTCKKLISFYCILCIWTFNLSYQKQFPVCFLFLLLGKLPKNVALIWVFSKPGPFPPPSQDFRMFGALFCRLIVL